MSIRKALFIGIGILALLAVGFLLVFPHVSKADERGKPSAARRAMYEVENRRRRSDYLGPIYTAITLHHLEAVEDGWQRYVSSPLYIEDPFVRLAIARFLVSQGKREEAHAQLDKIIHPPKGSSSTLRSSGEVMSLWLSTTTTESTANIASAKGEWLKASEQRGPVGNDSDQLQQSAKVEYLAAQELEAQTKPSEALQHYERATKLDSSSSFLWSARRATAG